LRPDRRPQGLGLQRDRDRQRAGQAEQQRAVCRNDAAPGAHHSAHARTNSGGTAFRTGRNAGASRRANSAEVERPAVLPSRGRIQRTGSSRTGTGFSDAGARCRAASGNARRRAARGTGSCRATTGASRGCSATIDVF